MLFIRFIELLIFYLTCIENLDTSERGGESFRVLGTRKCREGTMKTGIGLE